MAYLNDGYEAFRAIRQHGCYTTEDNILIKPIGNANNLMTQAYSLERNNDSHIQKDFWEPNTIFVGLDYFRRTFTV
ncbi:hypothetical protein OAL13_00110 [bacterium]|nr:hypothetical protein [bacterium]